MKRIHTNQLLLLVLLFSFFLALWMRQIYEGGRHQRLKQDTVTSMEFRKQEIGESMLAYLRGKENRGIQTGIYLLESKFGYQPFMHPYTEKSF